MAISIKKKSNKSMSKSNTSSRSRKHLNKSKKSVFKKRQMRGGNKHGEKPLSGPLSIKPQGPLSIRPLYNPTSPIKNHTISPIQNALRKTIVSQKNKNGADRVAKLFHEEEYRKIKKINNNRSTIQYNIREHEAEIYAQSVLDRQKKNPKLSSADLRTYGLYDLWRKQSGPNEIENTPANYRTFYFTKMVK